MSTGRVWHPVWNPPNLITMGRVAVIPLVIWLLHEDTWLRSWIAGWLFIAAIVGDWVDGYLARKMKLQSTLGAFLDPLADKLLVGSILIVLIPHGRVEAWLVAILQAREITITALRAVVATDGVVMAASNLGKYKTAFQGTAISLLCIHQDFFGIDLQRVGYGTLLVATFYSLWSAADYIGAVIASHRTGAASRG